ncbi:MAG: hypothetical protein NPIRA01_35080 [Nitrospirales bacterium]|nr:MAG: hypothetical protein NPIRA01_35080 [Nitrospirales bacterium]
MIRVMGVTGHTGRKITEALLKTGENVLALGRSENKLEKIKNLGADVLLGDTTDSNILAKAFCGADAVYALLPTDRRSSDYQARQKQEGETIVKAIHESGITYVDF